MDRQLGVASARQSRRLVDSGRYWAGMLVQLSWESAEDIPGVRVFALEEDPQVCSPLATA